MRLTSVDARVIVVLFYMHAFFNVIKTYLLRSVIVFNVFLEVLDISLCVLP